MYIMFPIGIMYYFGTNLDSRFSVSGFWPTKEQLNKIPYERDDIEAEIDRLKNKRLVMRRKRLQEEALEPREKGEEFRIDTRMSGVDGATGRSMVGGPLDQLGENAAQAAERSKRSWVDWVRGR
jgi:protein PET100